MSDYLHHLLHRVRADRPVVAPRVASRFEFAVGSSALELEEPMEQATPATPSPRPRPSAAMPTPMNEPVVMSASPLVQAEVPRAAMSSVMTTPIMPAVMMQPASTPPTTTPTPAPIASQPSLPAPAPQPPIAISIPATVMAVAAPRPQQENPVAKIIAPESPPAIIVPPTVVVPRVNTPPMPVPTSVIAPAPQPELRSNGRSNRREAAPTIHVSIGRVEVRAQLPAPPATPPARVAPSAPAVSTTLSLKDYFHQRDAARRGGHE